jgi:hypothetical protein
MSEVDDQGRPITGDTLLILLSAASNIVSFMLPTHRDGYVWEVLIDTATPGVAGERLAAGVTFALVTHSAAVLRLAKDD